MIQVNDAAGAGGSDHFWKPAICCQVVGQAKELLKGRNRSVRFRKRGYTACVYIMIKPDRRISNFLQRLGKWVGGHRQRQRGLCVRVCVCPSVFLSGLERENQGLGSSCYHLDFIPILFAVLMILTFGGQTFLPVQWWCNCGQFRTNCFISSKYSHENLHFCGLSIQFHCKRCEVDLFLLIILQHRVV